MAAWYDVSLATRFMAVDLPRNSGGDTLTIWAIADVEGVTADSIKNTVVLASAANLAVTAAFAILTANLV